ncbi:hypothetical protein GOP47_0009454, partial [Adiantum capillus-veneris]
MKTSLSLSSPPSSSASFVKRNKEFATPWVEQHAGAHRNSDNEILNLAAAKDNCFSNWE